MKKISAIIFLLDFFILTMIFGSDEKIILKGNNLYSINRNSGFEIYDNKRGGWIERNEDLPCKVVYPFRQDEVRGFTSININPGNEGELILSTPSQLFIRGIENSINREVPLKYPFKKSYYITSSASKGAESSTILIGTSFSGIFETFNSGASWSSYKPLMTDFDKGAGFFDDISALCYGEDNYYLFMATGFTRKLFALDSDKSVWTEISLPEEVSKNGISSLVSDFDQDLLYVYSGKSFFIYDYLKREWKDGTFNLPYSVKLPDPVKRERLKKASGRTGIYLSAPLAGSSRLEQIFSFLKKNNLNSVVIDFKDDEGFLTYNSDLETAAELGNISRHINLEDFLSRAEMNNIYVIARMVVFKDKQLFRFENNKYAVWDRTADAPWGNMIADEDSPPVQKEFWVDPFSEEVWDYNISIARELERRGVDEIQFDYIRFPTDGDLSNAYYRHRKEGMLNNEALESFLRKAREIITVPISTDLYGFNGWYRMGNWNGQEIDMVSEYVDVISPMFYPSHFPRKFLENYSYLERAELIYNEGSRRAVDIVKGKSIIRPFVQAFLIGGERDFEKPVYTDYLRRQLKGLYETDASGFTLWNASGSYYMVSENATDYIRDIN